MAEEPDGPRRSIPDVPPPPPGEWPLVGASPPPPRHGRPAQGGRAEPLVGIGLSVAAIAVYLLTQLALQLVVGLALLGTGLIDPLLLDPTAGGVSLLALVVVSQVAGLLETTKKEGAKVLCGGRRPAGFNKGYYYEPTIFDDVKDDFTIMKQEPFGPLVPILTFKDTDEVIKRANDNDLGLASYICTNSLEKAHKVSEQMETGTCAVNTPAVAFAEVPFGGMKQTGYGREGGSMAIKDYLNIKYTHFGISY